MIYSVLVSISLQTTDHEQPEAHNRSDPKTDNFKEKCIQMCSCMGIRERFWTLLIIPMEGEAKGGNLFRKSRVPVLPPTVTQAVVL